MTTDALLLPELPVMDEALRIETERLATGARIHAAMGELGIYRNAIDGAHRLAAMMREGRCLPRPVGEPTAREDLDQRIATAAKYAVRLQAFVVQQRLAALPVASGS